MFAYHETEQFCNVWMNWPNGERLWSETENARKMNVISLLSCHTIISMCCYLLSIQTPNTQCEKILKNFNALFHCQRKRMQWVNLNLMQIWKRKHKFFFHSLAFVLVLVRFLYPKQITEEKESKIERTIERGRRANGEMKCQLTNDIIFYLA